MMTQFTPPIGQLIRTHPLWFVLIAILLTVFLQGILAAQKATITHDETISYLSAVGRQGDFERLFRDNVYPANHWARAGEWQAWFAIDAPFSFRQIGLDLAESDIHPPLYFWLLHIWIWLFGVHAWTGPTLNMLLQAVGALGLFQLARFALKDHVEALAVTFIWLASPAVLTAVLEARQYSLLGVCTIFFIWLTFRIVANAGPLGWQPWLLLLLATTAGALTHYHFVLIVAGAGLVFVLKLVRQDFKRVLYVATAVLAGYLLFFLLHPQFVSSLQELSRRQALEARHLSGMIAILQRIYAVGNTFTGFWTLSPFAQLALFCLGLSFLLWLGLVLWKNPARLRHFAQAHDFTGYEMGLFFAWISGISVLLYLTFVSPIHAMTARHMSAVWPFFPFAAVLLLRKYQVQTRYRALLLLGTAVFLSTIFSVWQGVQAGQMASFQEQTDSHIAHVVVDGVYQGIFPRIFLQLPNDTLVFAATQTELLAEPEAWLPRLNENDVYISELSYNNLIVYQDQILNLLEAQFKIYTLPDDAWPVGKRHFLALHN